ncbi:WD40 repeat domain-containing protein [Aspergillus clavatus NRRL 1]|uniref:WD repeat protein n=1 Tax=Aspergillus clavatus (strain ATCC 1007 / CBS 513.65 / DSM 816 / NCTC 3887 / NRRL 1 / QM 1276 / 107) TaxID=344612 RepID=A1C4A3_ASPCL|nr:WD repeat protein [Aspergillus clavatus NRRL 1]EAW15243.1 WD repeat protein [Aspergillus clavatus NRRL 1]
MPGQQDFGSSTVPSSSQPAYPGDRGNPTSHLTSCDAPGSARPQHTDMSFGNTSSYDVSDFDNTPDAEAQRAMQRTDLDELPVLAQIPDPRDARLITEHGVDLTEAGVSAFTAVSQYPNAYADENESATFAVSEVVNAVIAREDYFRAGGRHIQTAPVDRSSSPPADVYMSDSDTTDVLGYPGGVPIGAYMSGGRMGMDSLSHRLVADPASGHLFSTIAEESDEDEVGDLVMDYESPMAGNGFGMSDREDDLDDTQKFYLDHDDEFYEDYVDRIRTREATGHLSDVDFNDFYRAFDYGQIPLVTEGGTTAEPDEHNDHIPEGEELNGEQLADNHIPASVIHGTTHERNFNIDQFISQWVLEASGLPASRPPVISRLLPSHPVSRILDWTPPERIVRPRGYKREFYDIQQIPWWDALKIKRSDARELRDLWYTSYHNVEYPHHPTGARLPQSECYFREESMHTKHRATIEHFQLRNLMSVPAYNTVHFSHESKVYSWVPGYDDLSCLVDLSKPTIASGFHNPVKISSMKSAHDICIAGGFTGEYALRRSVMEGSGVEGYVTKNPNGITNHIDIVPSRTSHAPLGIFASNDQHLRVLDSETNTFIADHELSRAINCTATSPDGRLRVVIGDSPDAWVVEADTGRPVHPLRGHLDFGFACAWSPDMRHIATSNQDKTVIIWDARTWQILQRIESDVAGYRSVRFSPVGGGPRTLLLAEPADRIAIVNAQTYQSRQVHDFFGEIGGADFSPDGSTIWVANTDEHFGGFMEFDRRQWGQAHGPRGQPNEWVRESELDEDERCVLSERERQMRFWWNLSDEEHEALLL